MAVSGSGTRSLWRMWQKFHYNLAGFNQLGLFYEDTLKMTPEVEEAVRRLPKDLYNERVFRIKRALDCSLKHRVLPKDQWPTFETDERYLSPYLEQVRAELREKAEWNKR